MNRDLADMRKNYALASLDIDDLQPNPIDQFAIWFEQALASKILEPNAMTLATAGLDLMPDARTVLLKSIQDQHFVFYTNYNSTKGKQLAQNKQCALLFNWLDLERQIRIKGSVSRLSKEQSYEYFKTRPRDSQIGAWVSPQSEIIKSRDQLSDSIKKYTELYEGKDIPLPTNWGGFKVKPTIIEFWQGRPNRLHDRFLYTNVDNHWNCVRLAP